MRAALSFLDCEKYPPSLLFLAMTLGPALCLLAWMDRPLGPWACRVAVYGRVPLFYYVAHVFLIHAVAIALAWPALGAAAAISHFVTSGGLGYSAAGRLCALGRRRARALPGVPVVRGREATERRGVDELPVRRRPRRARRCRSCCRRAPTVPRPAAATAIDPALLAGTGTQRRRIAETSARSSDVGWQRLAELADGYGHRITGSTALTGGARVGRRPHARRRPRRRPSRAGGGPALGPRRGAGPHRAAGGSARWRSSASAAASGTRGTHPGADGLVREPRRPAREQRAARRDDRLRQPPHAALRRAAGRSGLRPGHPGAPPRRLGGGTARRPWRSWCAR